MLFTTKNKGNINILAALSIVAIVAIAIGSLWIFRGKLYNPQKNIQNVNNEKNLPMTDNDKKEEKTKLSFDSNSEKNVYKIEKDGKWAYVINGQEGETYDQVANLIFSLDGEKFAYSAILDNQTYLIVNDVSKVVPYKQIINIVFSPNGNRIAYVAEKEENFVVVVDDTAGKEYQEIGILDTRTGQAYIVFSPDSQRVAYEVVEEDGYFIVVDQEEGKIYDEIVDFQFSNDSEQFAYEVVTEEGSFIVVNQQEGETYDDISDFQFSDDSEQFAYQAESGDDQITVINNSEEIINNDNDDDNNDNETQQSGTSSTPSASSTYWQGHTNDNPTAGTGETSPGGYDESRYQTNCQGSSGVMDCKK